MALEHELAEVAAKQHGLLGRDQILDLGLSASAIDRRVRAGRWNRELHSVFSVAGVPRTWEFRLMALSLGYGALASHRSGAALWRVDGFGQGIPEVVVERGRRLVVPGVRVHQSTDLDRIEPVVRRGIPTTPLDRTVLDLGAVLRIEDYQLVVERVVRSGSLTWRDLLDVLVRHARRGRDGVGRLRAVLDERYGATPSDSDFEVLVEALLARADLPRPVRQHEVRTRGGRFVARIDLAYPGQLVAIELDGRSFHSDRHSFERDRERQNQLVLLGWTVLRFTWTQLLEHPERIVAAVHEALRGRPSPPKRGR